MSDGHYCFVRDLGLVKGGKGMKHHEVVIDFSRRGLLALFKRAFARSATAVESAIGQDRFSTRSGR